MIPNNETLILDILAELKLLDNKVNVIKSTPSTPSSVNNTSHNNSTNKPTTSQPTSQPANSSHNNSSSSNSNSSPQPTSDSGVQSGMYGQIVGNSACSIYQSANENSARLGTIQIGQRFIVSSVQGDWYQISAPQSGYIPISFTSVQTTPITSVSQNLLKFTESWEGYREYPYTDSGDNWTVGIGHCTFGQKPAPETFAQAWAQMVQTFVQIVGTIQPYINKYNYTQYQVDAIADFCFNLGCGSFEGSDLLVDAANCQNNNTIVGDFTAWSYCDGQLLQGLYRRRVAESNMFLYGEYQDN